MNVEKMHFVVNLPEFQLTLTGGYENMYSTRLSDILTILLSFGKMIQ